MIIPFRTIFQLIFTHCTSYSASFYTSCIKSIKLNIGKVSSSNRSKSKSKSWMQNLQCRWISWHKQIEVFCLFSKFCCSAFWIDDKHTFLNGIYKKPLKRWTISVVCYICQTEKKYWRIKIGFAIIETIYDICQRTEHFVLESHSDFNSLSPNHFYYIVVLSMYLTKCSAIFVYSVECCFKLLDNLRLSILNCQ